MSNWWESLDNAEIDTLKGNCLPFGLMPGYYRTLFATVDNTLIQFFAQNDWHQMCKHEGFNPGYAYRLNPSWQRPEKKTEGHWEYCDVTARDGVYLFKYGANWWRLHKAFSRVGFGGFEFKEWSGRWFMGLEFVWENKPEHPIYSGEYETALKPATPARVRFWRE